MIQLVRPTEATMKEQAIEFRQEFFEHGNPSSTEVNYLIKRMIIQNGARTIDAKHERRNGESELGYNGHILCC